MYSATFSILLALFFSACDQNVPDYTQPTVRDSTQEDLEDAMCDFGFKAFLQINQTSEENENILISPLSIETALFMTNNGALNETQRQISHTLEVEDIHPDQVNLHYQNLAAEIIEDATEETFLIQSQAAFWSNLLSVDSEFRSKLESLYNADFRDNQFELETINGWVDEKTEGRIPQVLEEIQKDEIMILLNALYFIGDWDVPFHPSGTIQKEFQLNNNKTVQAEIMHQDHRFSYYISDDLNAVDLAFKGGKFAMTFIQSSNGINAYLDETYFLDMSQAYKELVSSKLRLGRLLLGLPKFEFGYKRNITEDLKTLGIINAFDESAELSGFGQAGGHIYLSRVIHDSFLKIDEKGAEGAAVTTVGVAAESLPPSINFDSPFMFILRHVDSSVPVFIGKIMDPTK